MSHEDEPGGRHPPASTEPDAEDREAILARRARFIATALLGMSVLPACDPMPRPCLEAQPVVTSGAPPEPPPMPCLSPVPGPAPSASSDPPDAGPPPAACLKIRQPPPQPASADPDTGPPPHPPRPCLMPLPPPKPSGGKP